MAMAEQRRKEELHLKSMAAETQEKERSMKNMDAKKAEQLQRLGMGASGVRTVSHSASAAMGTVDQVAPATEVSRTAASKRLGITSSTGFFDSYGLESSTKGYIDEPSKKRSSLGSIDNDDGDWGLSKYESHSSGSQSKASLKSYTDSSDTRAGKK
jgi:hypothetical protein